jgi:hypothetical protein
MLFLTPGRKVRIALGGLLWALAMNAEPSLTTIQDVLYKADGSRFNGYVQINWNSFEAGDTSNIATQFRAVRIVDGNLLVKLVPTTNAEPSATYQVTYNSDGKVQFQETWAVPPTSQRLRVRDVRISSPSSLSSTTGPLQESDIVGLVADLNLRPTEGPGYTTGRVIVSNAIGELEAVSGNLSDCVHVDGSSGPCGSSSSQPGYVDNEVPAGVIDGANAVFTIAGAPSPAASLALYKNGMLMKDGFDFSLSGSSIQFITAATPQPGDTLLASYRVSGMSAQLMEAATQSVETLCSGTGSSTQAATVQSLGECVIPAGTLKPGDRVEIRADYSHTGSASGFSVQWLWGSAAMMRRDAAASDSLFTARGDAAIGSSTTQFSGQSWGNVSSVAGTVGTGQESLSAPLTIGFAGQLAAPQGDTLKLHNFTVSRYFRE